MTFNQVVRVSRPRRPTSITKGLLVFHFFKTWGIRKPLVMLEARGGIEPPTHGFSVRFKVLLFNFIE